MPVWAGELGASTPNCLAYSAFSRGQPNFIASVPTMRPMGVFVEQAIQNIEANVPTRCAHGDEAAIDVGPQRQARAAAQGFEFPAHVEATPVVLERLRRVGSRHSCFGNPGRGRAPTVVSFTLAPTAPRLAIGVERSPLAQMRGVGKCLPDFFRRVAQFPDENERPLLPVLSDLRPAGRTRSVLLAIGHLLLLSANGVSAG